jgi:hypothetical protein
LRSNCGELLDVGLELDRGGEVLLPPVPEPVPVPVPVPVPEPVVASAAA